MATLKEQYFKERNRILRFIREAKKRGYYWESEAVPTIPKKITPGSIRRLKKITPDSLYDKAKYKDKKTGEVITGKQRRYQERKAASKKAAKTKAKIKARERFYKIQGLDFKKGLGGAAPFTDNVLARVENELKVWDALGYWPSGLKDAKEKDKNLLQHLLQAAIERDGRDEVAKRLEANAMRIVDLVLEILYASGSEEGNFRDGRTRVNADLAEMARLINGRALSLSDMKSLSDLTDLSDVIN